MKEKRRLNIKGAILDKAQLDAYLEKIASDHILTDKSSKDTYPIPRIKEDFEVIKEVYKLLNEHIELGIPIHPAGEWILDNFYIIEESIKSIIGELTLKKYTNFLAIANGRYKGFARIYVLASEMVAYTDGKIDEENLKQMLVAYQNKKSLSMDEIWNIGLFIQIALIENIRDICEYIYSVQMQKAKVENILSKFFSSKIKIPASNVIGIIRPTKMRNSFIEYMAYKLKKFGRQGYAYFNILEDEVNKTGATIEEIVKKEHFDIAVKKVIIGNFILTLKNISRINFLEIFETINGVEEILKKDPAMQYEKMNVNTKTYYRNKTSEIAKKTKISEIYIAKKCLELSQNAKEKLETGEISNFKETHIGYYLIDEGINKLAEVLQNKSIGIKKTVEKVNNYISFIWCVTIAFSLIFSALIYYNLASTIEYGIVYSIILFLGLIIPIENIVTKTVQFVLSKIVKPKLIPKIDFRQGIPEEYSTMVVIPSIVKDKEKVKKMFEKLEVFYIANKTENLYFTLLGDCSTSSKKEEVYDPEVIEEGIKQVNKLNTKYPDSKFPKFNFIYRKRIWNEAENAYMGWERKRGMLNQFNEYLLENIENPFRINTIENYKNSGDSNEIPNISYIITLDADTDLSLNSGIELVGAMAHILNKPILNENEDLVISGNALMQPRVGVGLLETRASKFAQIYAGEGGTDSYTNAISDTYQDNFGEGIFTGKGIYDLKVFSTVLNNEIKENAVLSHDLLEGSYLRCGLVSDIMLMDGTPTNYMSFRQRLYRWIRGDFQLIPWLGGKIENKNGDTKKNPLNKLSKYKILSNIIRSKQEFFNAFLIMLWAVIVSIYKVNLWYIPIIATISAITPFLLDLINKIFSKHKANIGTKKFVNTISGLKASFIRSILDFAVIPDKAYLGIKAEIKTLYRMYKSKKHLLEWITSEEAEKNSKTDLFNYYQNMFLNLLLGAIFIFIGIFVKTNLCVKFAQIIIGLIWILAPFTMCVLSKKEPQQEKITELTTGEIEYINEVGRRTWCYFKDNLNSKGHFLPPDNFQEDRKPQIVMRTSPTNIGLGILSVISSYDLKYENLEDTINLLYKMLEAIQNLQKWNGHLYNWYNIETLEPLIPRYISSVDSGNFVGYMYVLKTFLNNIKETLKKDKSEYQEKIEPKNKVSLMLEITTQIINSTDFSKLYNEKNRLFSVGFNLEEGKLTDSYYDLLASEARQTSLVAIAKKDVSEKHWYNLSRTLTTLNNYKGLISWSGTAFEYLMPNINIPQYPASILDESCKFMIMSQMEYAKKLGVPWGISEAAFNLKDLNNNYQYKAFGIPWLGLKRGLSDEIVISSYGTILAINEVPKQVIQNLKKLESENMYGKYGFYESIDFTPGRTNKGYTPVKTYMAHHQGLILVSINNLINNKIFQKRFMQNPEMQAIEILLQEKMPEKMIITKEEKEKVEKIKYVDYDDYAVRKYNKLNENLNISNVISNDKYTIVMNQFGNGYSKFEDLQINRYSSENEQNQGIFFYIKNIRNKKIWTNTLASIGSKPDKINLELAPEMNKIKRQDENIETITKIITDTDEPVEIRRLELKNIGNTEEILEITGFLEPILSVQKQDLAHPAFNNLFINFEYLDALNTLVVKRKAHTEKEKDVYMAVTLVSEEGGVGEPEFEIDKEKFVGRCNYNIPNEVKNSIPFSRKLGYTTDPIVAMKQTVRIEPEKVANIDFIISVGYFKEEVIKNLAKFTNNQNIKRTEELLKAKVEAENRYLGVKGQDIITYQKMLSYLLFVPKVSIKRVFNKDHSYETSELWKYGISGDLPILLVKIKDINDIDIVKEALNAYEYFRAKNIIIDLVILNEEKESYENYVKDAVQSAILNKNIAYLLNISGGIFCLNNIENKQEKRLLEQRANLVINANCSSLKQYVEDMEARMLDNVKETGKDVENIYFNIEKEEQSIQNMDNLKYYNEYGGFSEDGKEYLITVNKNNKTPTVWSHILANKNFGTLTTEGMGGYTWKTNCRTNRLTSWSNNQVTDIPSEIIYLKDMETNKKWSLGFNPMPDENNYYITYGFGYAKYNHTSSQIKQTVEVFVPTEESVKINLITLENKNPQRKRLKLIYYIKPVIGENISNSNGNINIEYNQKSNLITAVNMIEKEPKILYVSSSEKINSYTGSRTSFEKNGGISNPEGLDQIELNRENSYGEDGIIAVEFYVTIEAFETKKISLLLGEENTKEECQDIAYKYANISNCKDECINVKKYWENLVNRIQVKTPVESINILLNGWLMYQVIASRLYARTGFYQSGGAYGFRDQLQDTLGIKYVEPKIMRKQILLHANHQFEEGDVEHWWHEETNKGIRTRISDDLLWLAYVVCDYIEFTGDYSILEEQIKYKKGKVLAEGENERYDLYLDSNLQESIYNHCIRAIEKALKFGEHNLPKIGTGDWNDGLSNVGTKGIGESVWLGFFMYDVLNKFIPICRMKNDEEKAKKYELIQEQLKKALNTYGWDNRWYKRAYTDFGDVLGSLQNEECRIDSISQSWSVISGAGDNDKKYIAMESLENHLVDKEIGIIKLLDPPFEKSKLEPGYIKSYLPGTRENGGQYTHSAIWTIIAEAMLNSNEKAYEYYRMINPIEHAKTREEAKKYKVEPYVISADIYGQGNLAGRGGWTWYTGSGSWMIVAGLKYILGLEIKDGYLSMNPHIPGFWKEYEIKYKYGESIYNIQVARKKGQSTSFNSEVEMYCNNQRIEQNKIRLENNGKIYNINVIIQ